MRNDSAALLDSTWPEIVIIISKINIIKRRIYLFEWSILKKVFKYKLLLNCCSEIQKEKKKKIHSSYKHIVDRLDFRLCKHPFHYFLANHPSISSKTRQTTNNVNVIICGEHSFEKNLIICNLRSYVRWRHTVVFPWCEFLFLSGLTCFCSRVAMIHFCLATTQTVW